VPRERKGRFALSTITLRAAVAVAALACAAALAAQTTRPVPPLVAAVNMTTIESAPVFAAAEELGGAVRVVSGGIPLLTSGEADVATNAETQALIRSVADPGIRVILTVAECAYRIVGRRSAGLARVADLRGKRIATAANTSAHYHLAKTLKTAGLSDADVTVVPMPLGDMPAALTRHDVDAVSIWEPAAHNSLEALGADALVFPNGGIYSERFNLNTTVAVLNDPIKRRATVDLVRAIIRASASIRRNGQPVWPLVSKKINVREQTISATWREFTFPAALPRNLRDLMREEESWVAAAQKREPRTRDTIDQLVDASILRDATAR
jgi:ABC-type nitrate/sulfonate/bicarbonate transport system substrate-binding protein